MGVWHAIGDGEWVGSDVCAPFPVYTRGNAGEVYPEVYRPLSFSVAFEAAERAMRNALLGSGLVRPAELDGIPLTTALCGGVFGGYAYLNLSVQRLAAARLPGGHAEDADRTYLGGGDTDPPPHRKTASERNLAATLTGTWRAFGVLRTTEIPELAADQRRVADRLATLPDPATATDAELRWRTGPDLMAVFSDLFETHLRVSTAAGGAMNVLTQLCERQLGDPGVAVRLVAGLGDVDSAAPADALWRLSRDVAGSPALADAFDAGVDGLWARLHADPAAAGFVDDFRSFLVEFGSRGPNEWDTAFDTWETDPALALALVDRMRTADPSHDPVAQRRRLAAERDALEIEIVAALRRPIRPLFRRAVRAARFLARSRERSKTTVVRLIHGARLGARELDRRLVERSGGRRGDLWFLVDEELDDYLAEPGAFASTIHERRRMLGELERRIPPFYLDGGVPPLAEWPLRDRPVDPVAQGEVLDGIAGCPGVARGRARIVTDPGDPGDLQAGDVLVAPLTDPSWTPLFVPAEAVVVDVGAVMSHAVIVSRELGIPCTVSVRDATRRIPDGALIEVDGGTGTVTVVELP